MASWSNMPETTIRLEIKSGWVIKIESKVWSLWIGDITNCSHRWWKGGGLGGPYFKSTP